MCLLGDDVLVRRAARRVALQAAGLVAGAMLLLIALVTLVVVRGQQSASDRLLRTTAATADDVGDPPAGAWIVFDRGGTVSSSPGLPDDVGGELGALRTRPLAHPVLGTLGDRDRFRVLTARRSGRVVQVVQDLRAQQDQRDRLLTAMATAALLSLLVAAALGVLLGRRAVRPLAQALNLQRAFVADASHELRTPLTLLSTRVQVLDRGLQDRDVPQQLLADSRGVVADVARLGAIVEDLLVAADPRADDLHDAVDVAVLVADVAASAS
ncbi:MAG: histidine kinase dimerization/phospho-acceptor domain-containing protein, partial [Mycobacteriales bacterium]